MLSATASPGFVIDEFSREDDLRVFDCGNVSLKDWLRKFAWTNQQQAYVVLHGDRVAGLSAYDGLRAETREAAKDSKGFANHPVGIDALSRAKDADDAIDEAAPPLLSALSI